MARSGYLQLPTASMAVQLSNKDDWNSDRDRVSSDFFTIGYSGRSPEAFFAELSDAHVVTLVDVRVNPVSMYKPQFSKRNLAAALNENGIDYVHRPDLGVPREVRALSMETGSRQVIWDWYDDEVVPSFASRSLHEFFNFADHPVALMCTEADPTSCHRHRLSVAFERLGLSSFDL